MLDLEAAEERLPAAINIVGGPIVDHHSQTGLFNAPGSLSTTRRTTVPSMTGSGPSWSSQAARRVGRGRGRSHAWVVAGVQRHQKLRITLPPLPGTHQSLDDLADIEVLHRYPPGKSHLLDSLRRWSLLALTAAVSLVTSHDLLKHSTNKDRGRRVSGVESNPESVPPSRLV